MNRLVLTLFLGLVGFFCAFGQETGNGQITILTLDECISTGLQKNTQIKRAKNDELIATANKLQSIMNFFPTLTAGANYDYFFGNFFDQNAARQVSETTNSSNPNLSTNLTIFNSFANHYGRKQRVNEVEAAGFTTESTKLSVESTILANYLRVINDRENIKISEQRVELLEQQLDRASKRESVGVGNMEDVYNFQSQLATERLNLVTTRNTYQRDKLALLQSMQVDLRSANYEIADYQVSEGDLLTDIEPFDVLLDQILSTVPSVKASKANLEAAEYQMKAVSAARFPTVSAFGRLGSNYSSNGARNPETGQIEPNATFTDQIGYNAFEYVNFSLRIPIFDNYRRSTDYQVSKINLSNAEIGVQEAINTITNLAQQAYLDYVAAQETYRSARENLAALDQSFEFMKKRYETGNSDFYAYLESLNNKNRAEIQLINSKYSIVFRRKILDLYRSL